MSVATRAVASLGIVALSLGGVQPGSPRAENLWTGPLWDDGRAEFCLYRGVTSRYGEPRPTEARIIVVKEDLLRSTLVKSDAGPIPGRTVEAIKLNFLADFPTGSYTYHQAATVQFERTSMKVLKETMSHTESCGITFVRVGPDRGGALVHEAHSYWDGEADRRVAVSWPAGERMFWDGLPVSLRGWIDAGPAPLERRVAILPTQIAGRSPIESTRPVVATIRMTDAGTIEVPAGRFAARRFDVAMPGGTDSFWFDARSPHMLLRMETHAGRTLELRKAQRLDYWNRHANGDERVLLP